MRPVTIVNGILSRVPYFRSLLSYFLVAVAVAAIQGIGFSFAEDLPPEAVELHFGATTVVLERNALLSVAGRSKSDFGNTKNFDISPDGPASGCASLAGADGVQPAMRADHPNPDSAPCRATYPPAGLVSQSPADTDPDRRYLAARAAVGIVHFGTVSI
jgi:hypothetical protein